ncbi:MAG: adenylate/guanylate cyclase domain-containing protein, partial [Polyangia bacterium]|nr:adenylate/guanylate cyclase domain-containing protein [Polyangia bacterium]
KLRLKPNTVVGLQLSNHESHGRKKGGWIANLGRYADCTEARADAHDLVWWQSRVFLLPEGKTCVLWAGGEDSEAELGKLLGFLHGRDWRAGSTLARRIAEAKEFRVVGEAELRFEITTRSISRDRGRLELAGSKVLTLPTYKYLKPPLIPIARGASRLGVVSQVPDSDGVFRHYAPLLRHEGEVYGSLALAAAMVAYPEQPLRVEKNGLRWGKVRIPNAENGRIAVRFHGSGQAYPRVGIRHVLDVVLQRDKNQTYLEERARLVQTLGAALKDDELLPDRIRGRLVALWRTFEERGCAPKKLEGRLAILQDIPERPAWHTQRVQWAAEELAQGKAAQGKAAADCRAEATKALEEITSLRKRFNANPERVKGLIASAEALAYPPACKGQALKELTALRAIIARPTAAPKEALASHKAWSLLVASKACAPLFSDTLRRELLAADRRHPARFRKVRDVAPGEPTGRIFIVHAAAAGLRDTKPSPLDPDHLGGEITANFLDNLIHGSFVRRSPRWASAVTAVVMCLLLGIGTFLVIALTRSALWVSTLSFLISGLAVWAYATLAYSLYRGAGLWMDVVSPTIFGLVTWGAALATNFYQEGKNRRFVQDALGRYTSPALVRELMSNPLALSLDWGEKRDLTVFFSDLQGFTSISERLTPERLVHLLNEYLTEMTDIILEEGGIVDKYIGDAIMAFWGAPTADPSHAIRACRATVRMQKRLAELRPRWEKEYGEVVIARCGLNSGLAIAGNMGSKHKFNYTLMGDTVNLASRLEGANKPYDTVVMMGENTYARMKDLVVARELDFLAVKGKDKPVRVYELLGFLDEVEAKRKELVARFHEALDIYRQTKFQEAMDLFLKIIDRYGEDGPSRLYVGRCREYLRNPPPLDWDGVYRMTTK